MAYLCQTALNSLSDALRQSSRGVGGTGTGVRWEELEAPSSGSRDSAIRDERLACLRRATSQEEWRLLAGKGGWEELDGDRSGVGVHGGGGAEGASSALAASAR